MKVEQVRGFVVYYLAENHLPAEILTECMYFINKNVKQLNFKYSLCSTGLSSRNMKAYFSVLLEEDYIGLKDTLYLTDIGREQLGDIYMENDEVCKVQEYVLGVLKKSSVEVIKLASIVDMIMSEKAHKYGTVDMLSARDIVKQSAKNFAPRYMSEENFDKCIELINELDITERETVK